MACIRDEHNRVALARRSTKPFYGQWVMPGGKIDFGETIAAALRREVLEEVGLEIEIGEFIDTYEHIGSEDARHYLILYYHCRPLGERLIPDGLECNEARWVEPHQLDDYDLPPGARNILAQVYRDKKT